MIFGAREFEKFEHVVIYHGIEMRRCEFPLNDRIDPLIYIGTEPGIEFFGIKKCPVKINKEDRLRDGRVLRSIHSERVCFHYMLFYPLDKAYNERMDTKLIWMGMFIGSLAGGYVPLIWGGDAFSLAGVLWGGVGAFIGVWLGWRLSR